ncbi:aminopeptidase P family protein [Limibaculum sp. M0105]|uniref:Aminopeptidase P family protein n=1 Tax=Thermohalobaculum xanthum TaxID=2753746 RepID=A0A8J7M7F9_9RHOB|nr:aminopeptidase P family protein [Thermohalobaculum xanthum]MBK0399277.1 aminopeptidase P family protein [Thermohalobaculum xanthum]
MASPTTTPRPEFFTFRNGVPAPKPFAPEEYAARVAGLRAIMAAHGLDAVILTSMHGIAYYTGFLYCAFGRPFGAVVTHDRVTSVSANIDGGQPWRRTEGDNIVYTDWQRDNFWRAVRHVAGRPRRIGVEGDHLTLQAREKLADFLDAPEVVDIAPDAMRQRMVKSAAEIALIREGARVADIGGFAIRDAIRAGAREIDVAIAGRDAMEVEIARAFPDSELRDTWVWFQSGINTDGAHNPVTARPLAPGDILSLNCFPMISGYYTALERTLFLGEPDAASLKLWEANVGAHELGLSLIRPGVRCSDIVAEINAFLEARDLLRYRSFGYGHSFGILSHYYGREAGLELREDIDTMLEPGMVVSMEPMLTVPEGTPGAGGYREHDILVVQETGAENITRFPYGPAHNIVPA